MHAAAPIKRLCKSFTKDEGGNFAMIWALTMVGVVGAVGVAVDLTRGINARVNLADASDSVALMLAKSGIEDKAELMVAAQDHLNILYPGQEGAALSIVDVTRDGDTVTVQLADTRDTTFSRVLNKDTVDVSVTSSAVYNQREMDISLVLDTTSSMAGTKLASLKTAAGGMVDTLAGYESANVRMSVVPFANYVNVGLSRRNAPWIDVEPDSTSTKVECWMESPLISKSNCKTVEFSCDRDGVASTCKKQVCDEVRGEPVEVCGPITRSRVWNGCVGSRDEPLDTRPQFGGNRIPGLMNAKCGQELTPMSDDLKSVKSSIDGLTASGNTYMPAGLLWGWRSLDPRQPLAGTATKAEKVIILMTDGQNSRSKSGDWHEGNDQAAADKKTRDLCREIKKTDVTIYTIAYEVDDKKTQQLLSKCASGKANYFDAKNAAQLEKAFREIGESLNQLRITA